MFIVTLNNGFIANILFLHIILNYQLYKYFIEVMGNLTAHVDTQM
jgi:hypothetical protein